MINHLNRILYFLPYFSNLFFCNLPSYSLYPFGFPRSTNSSTLFFSSSFAPPLP